MNLSEDLKKKKKSKLLSRIIYLIIFSVLITLVYYYFSWTKQEQLIFQTYSVSTWNLDIYVSAEGKLISWKRLELNFPVSGKVTGILKKEWNIVSVDEEIASLDDSVYKLNLNQANISLRNAYAILNDKKTINKSSIEVYKKDVDLAQINLDNTKLRTSIDIDNSQNDYDLLEVKKQNSLNNLEIEKSNLELIREDYSKKISNLENIVLLKTNILFLDIEKYLWEIDELLGITPINEDKNDKYEDYLSAKNTSYKKEAEALFKDLNNSFTSKNISEIEDYSSKLKELISLTILVLENTIDSVELTNEEINSKKTTFQTYLNSFELNYGEYQIAKQNLDYEKTSRDLAIEKQNNLIISLNSDLSVLEKDLSIAKQKLEDAKELSVKDLTLSEKQLEKANAEYIEKTSGLTDEELKPYYIAIEDAKNNVAQAEENLKDTSLLSPVDWTILDINYKVWEYYGAWTKPFAVVISSNNKYIEAYIEERDIINIYEWQKVKISLDAFDNYSFEWEVIYVSDKWEEDENEVITYKTLISFDEDSSKMKDSMSASLEFLSQSVRGDIVVPVDYIYYENWEAKVALSSWTSVIVKEWISDGEFVQVLEWLNVWDVIVLKQ